MRPPPSWVSTSYLMCATHRGTRATPAMRPYITISTLTSPAGRAPPSVFDVVVPLEVSTSRGGREAATIAHTIRWSSNRSTCLSSPVYSPSYVAPPPTPGRSKPALALAFCSVAPGIDDVQDPRWGFAGGATSLQLAQFHGVVCFTDSYVKKKQRPLLN